MRYARFLVFSVLCLWSGVAFNTVVEDTDSIWFSRVSESEINVNLYFFWSKKCPHCRNALPFIKKLGKKHEWLKVYSRELTEHPENVKLYIHMAKQIGQKARSVPGFMWCNTMLVGYDNPNNIGTQLEQQLIACYQYLSGAVEEYKPLSSRDSTKPTLTVPLLGTISLNDYSLATYTVILAGMDAFNPCAFFVLLFLLSLLTNAKSRKRMLLVGGIFVLASGTMYFLFMAAWLNVFLLIGQIHAITVAAGIVAIIIGTINVKDYFWFKRGISLSIPNDAKPDLFRRMRNSINAENLPAMLTATIGLASFANLYEFLCTAGFPMVFTRILTMQELPTLSYYLYLVFYNAIYVVPLFVITVVFALTLGKKKLQEQQGKQLKLISGMMMTYLGIILVWTPDWLNNAIMALAIILGAVLTSMLVIFFTRKKPGNHSA